MRWMGPVQVRESLEDLIEACRAEADPDLLIAYANYPSTEYLEPRNADFTAFNIFLEDRQSLQRYLPRLQNLAGDRPVLITEFGLDTVRHREEEQAETLAWHLEECLEAGVAGTTLFAWSDLWANSGRQVDDWAFGLKRRDGSEKPALTSLHQTLPPFLNHRQALDLEKPPRISIVVCTYNGGNALVNCLRACRNIEYPSFEIIVIDDGSTDATAEITAGFPEASYVHQQHSGLSLARNCGANLAGGELIAYTDDDCEPDRDWLFWIARAFADPKVGAAGGPNLPPEPNRGQEAVVAAAPGAPSHVLLDDLRAEHLPGCNLVVRREAFEAVGGFKPQFESAGDDVDFCWRLLQNGWELAFVPSAFVWHRRRTSFFRYLKQQSGYGRAEALLYKAHPDRFNRAGIEWLGGVYTGGTVTTDGRSPIYFGPMGLAGYQGLQRHTMPRRELHRHHDSFATRLLLATAELAQPWARALSRWLHGGPAPTFRKPPPLPRTYRDDLRQPVECAFLGADGVGRREFLVALLEDGW
ncbi:MAG: glycosyltransferase, partial [Akkermansiaceae bacterium]|nr:glycosyltransferase [Akkermansiaceae bacterium]